jgi:uncharacterized protein
MSNPTNEAVVREFVTAIEAGDTETLTAIIAPDATWTLHGTLPVSGHYVGRQAILTDFLTQGLGLYRPGTLRLELTRLVSDGDVVAIEWHAVGTSAGGNAYDNDYAFFFTLTHSRITSIREYCDTLHVRDALYA